jgi:branched-subunit amino acid ABC-type transport system permease component
VLFFCLPGVMFEFSPFVCALLFFVMSLINFCHCELFVCGFFFMFFCMYILKMFIFILFGHIYVEL